MKVADNSGKLPPLPCRCKQNTTRKQLIRHEKATIPFHQNISTLKIEEKLMFETLPSALKMEAVASLETVFIYLNTRRRT